ncbi:MAG: helix-turn-helix transcriptional regulator [Candidatus Velthaea sp.]
MGELYEPQLSELELAPILSALADPVRLAIIAEIHERGEVTCGTFDVPVAKSTLSHHLRVLREAGLTWTRIAGVERFITLREKCVERRFPGLLSSVLYAVHKQTHKKVS